MELLVVVAIIALLMGILVPSLAPARQAARTAVCSMNLRHLHLATMFYLDDNRGAFFPYSQPAPGGTLWYWGFEDATVNAAEGSRPLDKSRARLAPYLSRGGGLEVCPNVPYGQPYFKRKYDIASYGYAVNRNMMSDAAKYRRFDRITRPAETVAWADAAQINTFQAPASPSNPMLEEWYYLDNVIGSSPKFHFRHQKACNSVSAAGSVRPLQPYSLDARCDGLMGAPEKPVPPSQVSNLLRLDK
jgi:type II secretory pathway pseudopilin PulG